MSVRHALSACARVSLCHAGTAAHVWFAAFVLAAQRYLSSKVVVRPLLVCVFVCLFAPFSFAPAASMSLMRANSDAKSHSMSFVANSIVGGILHPPNCIANRLGLTCSTPMLSTMLSAARASLTALESGFGD